MGWASKILQIEAPPVFPFLISVSITSRTYVSYFNTASGNNFLFNDPVIATGLWFVCVLFVYQLTAKDELCFKDLNCILQSG